MMGYYGNMMGWGGADFGGYGLFAFLTWLIIFIDLILLGVWLWRQLQKK